MRPINLLLIIICAHITTSIHPKRAHKIHSPIRMPRVFIIIYTQKISRQVHIIPRDTMSHITASARALADSVFAPLAVEIPNIYMCKIYIMRRLRSCHKHRVRATSSVWRCLYYLWGIMVIVVVVVGRGRDSFNPKKSPPNRHRIDCGDPETTTTTTTNRYCSSIKRYTNTRHKLKKNTHTHIYCAVSPESSFAKATHLPYRPR